MLLEIVCKKLTIFHALQICARALPESVIFRRDFHGILPEILKPEILKPELRQIQYYCQRSVYYPEMFSNILNFCEIKPNNLQIFGSLNFREINKFDLISYCYSTAVHTFTECATASSPPGRKPARQRATMLAFARATMQLVASTRWACCRAWVSMSWIACISIGLSEIL